MEEVGEGGKEDYKELESVDEFTTVKDTEEMLEKSLLQSISDQSLQCKGFGKQNLPPQKKLFWV